MLRIVKLLGLGAAVVVLALAAGDKGSFSLAQGSCTVTVSPDGSIQRAIDNASPGAIICVRAGTYREGISITKPLTLQGEGRSSVTIVGSLSITNTIDVTVRGLTIRGGRGLVVVNSSKVALHGVGVVESEAVGVLVSNSSIEIVESLISANKLQGVALSLNSSALVTRSDFTKNGADGLLVAGSAAEVRLNFIADNGGCGVKAENAALTGGGNVISANTGGNLCGAPDTLLATPLPPPTNLRVSPQDWTNAPLLDWDNPPRAEVAAAWYKLGSEPQARFDGTRTTQKPIRLDELSEGERTITVYLWLEDKNGVTDHRNRAQGNFTVRIERTPPRITATLDPPVPSSGWYTITPVKVSFKCEDDRSGIASCSSPVTVDQEGETRVQGEAVDKAGNKSVTTVWVRIDKTPPTGSLTINDGAASTNSTTVTLRISANDAVSGVEAMRFSNDGRTWSDWERFQSTRSWDLSRFGGQVSTAGPKTVYAQLRDRAGNISQAFSATIRLAVPTLSGHYGSVYSVAFSPDGRLLASGSCGQRDQYGYCIQGEIKLWDVGSGREVRTLSGHTRTVESVAFSPDGRLLASGSDDKTIKLWDVGSGREVRTLSGHTDWVRSVAFSPDGRLLASGSWDNTIKLWDISELVGR